MMDFDLNTPKKQINKKQINNLIEINKIKLKTITDLIQHEKTPDEDKDKLLSCRRFIKGFIDELKSLI